MPIAMNFDLLSNKTPQIRCEHLTECETNLEMKLSKSPLSNGTNRPTTTPPSIKPRLRSTSNRITRKIDLEELSQCSSTRKFYLPNVDNEKWLAVATSNEHVLVGGGSSSVLRLFDLQGKELRLIDIKIFAAFDLAWSSVLNAFLIAGYDRVQIYDVEKDQLIPVENLNLINKKENYFWSITCHRNDAFVVLSDGLEAVWRLALPSFKRTQTLSGSEIRESNIDDRISCIRTNGRLIGMTLRQHSTNQWRVDLFDYVTMIRTHRGLTIGYGTGAFNFSERCMLAPVNEHQWLIVGGHKVQPNALTLMDDRSGEIKQVERANDRHEEFLSNISTSENSKQQQIISMILMNNQTGQRQIHVLQQ